MNLICITESELSQWVSRRYLDTLTARILKNREFVTADIFRTSPYLKLDDARGRIIVNLKENWEKQSLSLKTDNDVDVVSIPVDAVLEIAPAMDQYARGLTKHRLPIAEWSAEKIWDHWLISQAVMETRRAIVRETNRIGCFDRGFSDNQDLLSAIVEKALRPKSQLADESILLGWSKVLANRDTWIHWLRVEGHLDNLSMLKASAEKISKDLGYQSTTFNFLQVNENRGWVIQDVTPEILQEFAKCDSEHLQTSSPKLPPLFCIAAYLRLYDEIHNRNKDWRVVFNLLRFAKYSVNSLNADILTVALLASLKADDIYREGLRDLYMSW